MNKLFKLSSSYGDLPIGYQESIRYYKGVNEISFDISEVHTEINPIIKLDIDFNDGSEVLTKNYNFKFHNTIVDVIHKTYYPDINNQNVIYYPTLFLKFLNGKDYVYQCPIKISKNSFYSEFSRIDVAGVQFIDNIENSLFVTLDTIMGDILNIKIK
jgi:hypothetical protein